MAAGTQLLLKGMHTFELYEWCFFQCSYRHTHQAAETELRSHIKQVQLNCSRVGRTLTSSRVSGRGHCMSEKTVMLVTKFWWTVQGNLCRFKDYYSLCVAPTSIPFEVKLVSTCFQYTSNTFVQVTWRTGENMRNALACLGCLSCLPWLTAAGRLNAPQSRQMPIIILYIIIIALYLKTHSHKDKSVNILSAACCWLQIQTRRV